MFPILLVFGAAVLFAYSQTKKQTPPPAITVTYPKGNGDVGDLPTEESRKTVFLALTIGNDPEKLDTLGESLSAGGFPRAASRAHVRSHMIRTLPAGNLIPEGLSTPTV